MLPTAISSRFSRSLRQSQIRSIADSVFRPLPLLCRFPKTDPRQGRLQDKVSRSNTPPRLGKPHYGCFPNQFDRRKGKVKTMQDYIRIRQMREIEGLSLREIARQTGRPRDTIKKILAEGGPPICPIDRHPSPLSPWARRETPIDSVSSKRWIKKSCGSVDRKKRG